MLRAIKTRSFTWYGYRFLKYSYCFDRELPFKILPEKYIHLANNGAMQSGKTYIAC